MTHYVCQKHAVPLISAADATDLIFGMIVPLPVLPAQSSFEQQANWVQGPQVVAVLHLFNPIAIL
jgi:hypothetical protein